MPDLNTISQQAGQMNQWFQTIFYALITLFLLFSVFLEYFKWPLGGVPSFGPLIGRVLIAAILLHTYPDVTNAISDLSDALSAKLGNLVQFQLVLGALSDKIHTLSWSWTSVKQSVITLISFLSFFVLYFSIHVAQAFQLYAVTMLYIFSPLLIAFFVFPQTAPVTGALYRSLIEVSLWKPVWCVIATLLWSTGVGDIQGPASQVSFLSAICFCLIGAGSLILTPLVVHALAGSGISSTMRSLGSLPIDGVGRFTPAGGLLAAIDVGKRLTNASVKGAEFISKPIPNAHRAIQKIPRFQVSKRKPLFEAKKESK